MYCRIYRAHIQICTDNKAAINALMGGIYPTFGLVRECRTSLNEVAEHSYLKYTDLHGNAMADGLARCSLTTVSGEWDGRSPGNKDVA